MNKKISILLIILGIILILIPSGKNQIIKYNIRKKTEKLESISHEQIIKNQYKEVEFDYDSIDDISITSTIIESIDFDDERIIGQLLIPDLNINLPILKGVTNTNLLTGASTMIPEQKMGTGNYPLAGHLMKQKDLLFGSLMDIEIGSIAYLTDKKNIYEYKIYDTLIVKDTDIDMLKDRKSEEHGKPIISLMTCYYSSKTGKRFFALGELIDQYPVEQNELIN